MTGALAAHGIPMGKQEELSPIVAAAETLDRELRGFSELATALRRETFGSEKSVERGAELLRRVTETDARLAQALSELVQAIGTARDTQAAEAEAVAARARELKERDAILRALLAQHEALGQVAAQVNRGLLAMADGETDAKRDAMASALPDLVASVAKAAEAGKELAAAAQSAGFPDVARNAETLRQQLLGAQNRMVLLQKRLDGGS